MRVYSIFNSVSGEVGLFPQGSFVTFIRLAGCNLCCSYCDTSKAIPKISGKEMPINSIIQQVKEIGCKRVLITGGEPLVQKQELQKLLRELAKKDFRVTIETNGSIPCDLEDVDCWIIDYKTPSSGMDTAMMCHEEFNKIEPDSFIKFVCSTSYDVLWALKKVENLPNDVFISFSTNPDKFPHAKLVEMLQEEKRFDIIVNYQIHKAIWPNPTKEV